MARTKRFWLLAAMGASVVAGCGGGGGSTSLGGVAAVGSPIVGGTINVRCSGGSALSTTTGNNGVWTVSLSGQTLPCAVQVSGGTIGVGGAANTRSWHSIALNIETVNVTPLTDLVVARLAGAVPDAWFGNPSYPALTQVNVTNALSALNTALGLTSTLGSINPFTSTFNAAPGDTMDNTLQAISAALTALAQSYANLLSAVASNNLNSFSGFSAQLTSAYANIAAAGGGGGGGGGGGNAGSLGTLTISAASNGARNGNYTLVGAGFVSAPDAGFNGASSSQSFEAEIVWASNANVKRAHVWFFAGNTIKFFGCDATTIPCTGVSYEPLLNQVWFTNVTWHEVIPSLNGQGTDTLVPSGETITVNGKLDAH